MDAGGLPTEIERVVTMATNVPSGSTSGTGTPGVPDDTAGPLFPRSHGGWTAWRVVTVVIGSVLALVSLGLLGGGGGVLAVHDGSGTIAPPGTAGVWAAQAAGTGTQMVRWTAQDGGWMAVAMNPDGSAGVAARADAGVSAPGGRG